MEVEATVSAVVGLRDCVVYGVRMMRMLITSMLMMMTMVALVVVVEATFDAVAGLRDMYCL